MTEFPVLLGDENMLPSLGGVGSSLLRGPQILQSGHIQSMDFLTGVDGWVIRANGDMEVNDGVFRGTITATAGAIGGFTIGADYVRDAADSFGLASTVTAGDDVRFWAGATFANRATAPYRLTEAGILTAAEVHIGGGTIAATSYGVADGTELLPSFYFTGDPDTGIRRPGINILGFVTAGADRWQIDASGHLEPSDDNAYNLGSATKSVLGMYGFDIYDEAGTKRFDLGGDWTPALHIIPGADNTSDLGTAALSFKDIYAYNLYDENGVLRWDLGGNAAVAGTLGVTGVTTLTGLLNANGGLAVDGTKFTVGDGTGDLDTEGYVGALGYASQTTKWRVTNDGAADFRYLFTDEMHAKSFIADLEQALAGGQIISKSVAMVGAGSDSWGYGGSGAAFNAASPLLVSLPYLGVTQALVLPGLSGNTITVPDSAAVSSAADLDIRFDLALRDYTAAIARYPAGKRGAAGQYTWYLSLSTTGKLSIITSADGTAELTTAGTVALPFADMTRGQIRVTFDANDGAGNRVMTVSTRTDGILDSTTGWTTLETVTTAGATSLFDSTAALGIGGITLSSAAMSHGAMLAFWFATTIGGTAAVYADFTNPTQFTPGSLTGVEGSANAATVTITQGTDGAVAEITDKSLFLGTGTEYLTVTDRDSLDMAAADSFTLAMMMRTSASSPGLGLGMEKLVAGGQPGYALYSPSGLTVSMYVIEGANSSFDDVTITLDQANVVVGVRDVAGDTVTAYLNGVASGSSATDTTAASLANASNLQVFRLAGGNFGAGSVMWFAILRRILTAAEHTELGAWNGKVATEPGWLRAAATFYTNADDPVQAAAYLASNSVVNLVSAAFVTPATGSAGLLVVRDLPSAEGMAAFESGDTVVLRSFSRASGALTIADAVGVVTGYQDLPDKKQAWTFTRNAGAAGGTMAAATPVAVDSLAIDYGTTGNGYYEVNAIDGAYGANSPYAQVVTWATSPIAANKTVRARFGKLTGITGTADEFGLLAGTYAATNGSFFRASNSVFELHGITQKFWDGATNVITLAPGGGSPYIALGNPVPAYGAAGVFLGWNNPTAKARFSVYSDANNYLTWDGVNLAWKGANTSLSAAGNLTATSATLSGAITASSGAIGGWVVTADAMKDAAGTVGMSSAVTAGDDIRFWAGNATPASAPFRVTEAGALVATSATITGAITATSGTFGVFQIGTIGTESALINTESSGTTNKIGMYGSALEIGWTKAGGPGTASVDFHTGDDVNYNARINVTGGSSGLGGGTLVFEAAAFNFGRTSGVADLIFTDRSGATNKIGLIANGLEIGNTNSGGTSASVDFHTGDDVNYNARIDVTGGASGLAGGTMNLVAAVVQANGTQVGTWRSGVQSGTIAHTHYNTTTALAANLYGSSGDLYNVSTSSERIKRDIKAWLPKHNPILDLTPISFVSVPDSERGRKQRMVGFTAEDVRDHFPEAYDRAENCLECGKNEKTHKHSDDCPEFVADLGRYDSNMLIAALIAQVQAQEARLARLEVNV